MLNTKGNVQEPKNPSGSVFLFEQPRNVSHHLGRVSGGISFVSLYFGRMRKLPRWESEHILIGREKVILQGYLAHKKPPPPLGPP